MQLWSSLWLRILHGVFLNKYIFNNRGISLIFLRNNPMDFQKVILPWQSISSLPSVQSGVPSHFHEYGMQGESMQ